MRDINAVYADCRKKLEDIGIQCGNVMAVTVNTRAASRWGQCKRINGYYTINISARLLDDDVELVHLEDTMIHELLHTCDGCMNHGAEWKRRAEMVNRAYGYNIKRTASAAEKGIAEDRVERAAKYKFVCNECGQVITRNRASDFTRRYTAYRCGICKGTLRREF